LIENAKPHLADFEKVKKQLMVCYDNHWVTNNGPLVRELESELANQLDLDEFALVANGTLALQVAIKSLGLTGDIITTPFSFVATCSALIWEGLTPVFADINPQTYNIDPSKIEEKITPETTAILATHVFGNPCDVEEIEKIAKKYGLKVIYDGAHTFKSTYKGRPLLEYGDISILSLHATKLFHCIEGGGIYSKDKELLNRCKSVRAFGMEQGVVNKLGINAKLSEIHAAFGLAAIDEIDHLVANRKRQFSLYEEGLAGKGPWSSQKIVDRDGYNFSYFTIVFDKPEMVEKAISIGKENGVVFRRYFYPSLNKLDFINSNQTCEISESLAERIICLPLFEDLTEEQITKINKVLMGLN
jgi:dTDP-4-amino-4,6-dideoxygalactose transaminase